MTIKLEILKINFYIIIYKIIKTNIHMKNNTIKTLVKSALKKQYEILSVEKTNDRRYDGKLIDDNGIEFKYILRFTFRNDRIYSFSVDIYNKFNSWKGEEIICEQFFSS